MNLFRSIVLAALAITLGVIAPARAASPDVAVSPTKAHIAFGSDSTEQKKKSDSPPRPRPKSGPKDGGEDE